MHFFLLLFIPATVLCLLSTDSEYSPKQLSFPVFLGFFAGIASCLFIEFFVYSDNSMGSSFLSILLPMTKHTFIPSIVLTALFMFFSKDTIEYRIYSVLPLLGMFQAVYTPYMTFTQGEEKTFFMIFANPVLSIMTILFFACAVKYAAGKYAEGDKKGIAVAAGTAALSLLVQPALFSLWYLDVMAPVICVLAFLLLPISIFVYKFFLKR